MQEREWVAHLNACTDEGVTVKAYAKQHDLPVDSLYYWRRKMKLRAGKSSSNAAHPSSTSTKFFARLDVTPIPTSANEGLLRLRLSNHLQLEMYHLPPVEWLAALMQIEGVR